MKNNQLFNSSSEPIPEIRPDLQIIPIEEEGKSYLYFHDERGYATPDLALHRQAETLLSLIDGQKSIDDLEPYLGDEVSKDQILQFVQFLDKNRLLSSNHFEQHARAVEKEYESSVIHQSVTAGSSYPADPKELREYLDQAFERHGSDNPKRPGKPKALYAPHIDPRVALESYVQAFDPVRHLQPKRVVIIATSHYAGLYPDIYRDSPFALVNKDFELPLGTINRDKEAIKELGEAGTEYGITLRDRAHRMEHSIELHLLFLSYLWDHDFEVVPFLTRGLDDLYYMEEGHLGQQLNNFSQLLNSKYGHDEDTFFLISGDLAHFGKKFGDAEAASQMFGEVESFDQKFLKYARQGEKKQLLELMKENTDPYRICGFPPLYTFLQSMPDLEGEILSYDLWDERERDSAVTFGSILYEETGKSG